MKRSTFSECLTEAFSRRSTEVVIVYFLLQLIVTALLLCSLLRGQYNNAGFCILSLLLFQLPDLFSRSLHVSLPAATEILFLLFIFAAEILGELGHFYLRFLHWDTLLHTTGGLLAAALGFTMIDLLNRSKAGLSPLFCAASAFCFSMTVGVFWEFFEFGMDVVFHTDMQKDTVFYQAAIPFLDIGLYDTMGDLLIHFLSTAGFCIFGFFHICHPHPGSFAGKLIPILRDPLP